MIYKSKDTSLENDLYLYFVLLSDQDPTCQSIKRPNLFIFNEHPHLLPVNSFETSSTGIRRYVCI